MQPAQLLLCSLALAALTCEAASFEVDFTDKATLEKVAIMGSAQFSYKHGRHPWRPDSVTNAAANFCPNSEVPRVPTGNNPKCLWVGTFKCSSVAGGCSAGCASKGLVKTDDTMTELTDSTSTIADFTCLCEAQSGGADCAISAQYGELCKTCEVCSGRGTLETDIRGKSTCYCSAGYSGDRCQCRGYGCWATGSLRLVDCEFNMYPTEITPAVGDDLQYQKNDWIDKQRIGDTLENPDYKFITDYKRATWEVSRTVCS